MEAIQKVVQSYLNGEITADEAMAKIVLIATTGQAA